MLRSLYAGVSGMRAFQTKLDVIGNNIANVNTIGFKGSRVMFKDIMSQTIKGVSAPVDGGQGGVNAQQIGLGVTVASIDISHQPGSAMTTNQVTDLRIDGDGFFAVSPIGDETVYLTRSGNFTIDAQRNLVNAEGLHVIDTGGAPVQLEEEVVAFSISQNGEIVAINEEGAAEATGIFIAVVKVANPGGLENLGGNLYRSTPNATVDDLELLQANDQALGTGAIISGQLEMSNVELTNELTEMIIAQRGFQANSRIITTSDEVMQEILNLKR